MELKFQPLWDCKNSCLILVLSFQVAAAKQILEQESQATEAMTEELGHYPGPEALKTVQPGGGNIGGRAPPGTLHLLRAVSNTGLQIFVIPQAQPSLLLVL